MTRILIRLQQIACSVAKCSLLPLLERERPIDGQCPAEAESEPIFTNIYSPAYHPQAIGRICRLGQTRAATCVRLIISDSIEPNILRWQERRLAEGASLSNSSGHLSMNEFVHVLGQR